MPHLTHTLRHTVAAPEVAQIRNGDPEIGDLPVKLISHDSVPSECTIGEMALPAVLTQAAGSQAPKLPPGEGKPRKGLGQHHIQHGGLRMNGRAGDTQNRHIVPVGHREHIPRLGGDALGDHLRSASFDGGGGQVVRVHTHAARS